MDKAAQVKLQDSYDRYLPFLMEIRKRLFYVAAIFLSASAFGFINYERVVHLLLKLFQMTGVNIVFTSPFQYINLAISSAFLVGFVVVFPLLVYQLLSFLKPALTKKEYRLIITLVPLSLLLFLAGFGFGIFMLRYILALFYQKSLELDIGNFLDVSKFLSQMMSTSMLMGIGFQFPMVLTILMRLKIVKYKVVAKQRMLAYVISIVFAALLPPTDLISLVFLTLPFLVLFELTLLLNKTLHSK